MKNTILTVLVLLSVSFIGQAQTYERGSISIDGIDVYRTGYDIAVVFDIVIYNYEISTQEQLNITPIIEGREGQRAELPNVIINGKRRGNIHKRLSVLNKNTGTPIFQSLKAGRNPFSSTVVYKAETVYQNWMDGANIYMYVATCGCGGTQHSNSGIIRMGKFTIPEVPVFNYTYTPAVHFIEPSGVTDYSARIMFPSNGSAVLSGEFDNRTELDKIESSLQYLSEKSAAQVTIQAYASPEGTYQHNLDLSAKRAVALSDYISKNYSLPVSDFHYEGKGEDWDGLLELVEKDPVIPNKEEVLHIIRTSGITDSREKQLTALSDGRAYRYMFESLFPQLRRADYSIKYTSPDFAGGIYPDDDITNLNAAAASIQEGEIDSARTILEQYRDRPDAFNNLGVVMMHDRRFDEAEEYLKKAQDNGSREASANLAILSGLRQAADEYEKNKARYDRYKR